MLTITGFIDAKLKHKVVKHNFIQLVCGRARIQTQAI